MFKDFVFLLCFTLTCTFAYQAVEEKRFFEQYLLTAFLIMQVRIKRNDLKLLSEHFKICSSPTI